LMIAIFILIFFPYKLKYQVIHAISDKAQTIAGILACNISQALFENNRKQIEQMLQSTMRYQELVYFIVINDSGQVVFEFNRSETDRIDLAPVGKNNCISPDGTIYKAMRPVLYNYQEIGQFYLGVSLKNLEKEIIQSRIMTAIVSFSILIISVIAVLGISTVVTRPLRRMVDTVDKVARGDFTQRVFTSSNDEVDILAKKFNLMVAALENYTRELKSEIDQRERAESEVRRLNEELEQRVKERTAQLEASNKDLEAFAYSVSHDLRAPLRHVEGFVELLKRHASAKLDANSQRFLNNIADSTTRLGRLIDDLLAFARMGKAELVRSKVNLSQLVTDVLKEFEPEIKGRTIVWQIAELSTVYGDPTLLRQVMANLIDNAIKFTRPRQETLIEIGSLNTSDNENIVFVRDNGVGFNMKFSNKLFGVFQRLHSDDKFEGTGIGLANVKRIINRHGGKVWAEGKINKGATFFFSLPKYVKG
ncbi:HAMP domain-containing protein, partial [candidate division KSB1 bacterium]